MLSEADILDSLTALDRALGRRGIRGEVCLFGGAVMVLAYHARQSTRDIDAIFAPAALVREVAARVGEERGWEAGWLNDGVKGFVSTRHDAVDVGLKLPNLAVVMPVPEYLLAMKCMAARVEAESRDLDDVKFLCRHLGLSRAEDILDVVQAYYPPGLIQPRTQYFVEAAAEELQGERDSLP